MNEGNLHQVIFRVAYDIYERSGRIEGRDLDNWLEAERIVKTLRQIAGGDDQRHIFINVPPLSRHAEEERLQWGGLSP